VGKSTIGRGLAALLADPASSRTRRPLARVSYEALKSRQQENYNFQKVSAVLADYGFVTLRLSDDWQGADFIAQHVDGEFLKVQLKGRLEIDKKYLGRDLHVCFPSEGKWYLFAHDEVCEKLLAISSVATTQSWREEGSYSWKTMSKAILEELLPYEL
jgi:hypothetical protein